MRGLAGLQAWKAKFLVFGTTALSLLSGYFVRNNSIPNEPSLSLSPLIDEFESKSRLFDKLFDRLHFF